MNLDINVNSIDVVPELNIVSVDVSVEVQTGINGENGYTPTIGQNKHWWINGVDTGIVAEGQNGDDGLTPFIGQNGNWWIGATDTGVSASGGGSYTPDFDLILKKIDLEFDGIWIKIPHTMAVHNLLIKNVQIKVNTTNGTKSLTPIVNYPSAETYNGTPYQGFYLRDVESFLRPDSDFDLLFLQYDVEIDTIEKYDAKYKIYGENVINNHYHADAYHSDSCSKTFLAAITGFTKTLVETVKDILTNYTYIPIPFEPTYARLKDADMIFTPYTNATVWESVGSNSGILEVTSHWGNTFTRHDITASESEFFDNAIAVGARLNDITTKAGTSYGFGIEFFEDIANIDEQFPDDNCFNAFCQAYTNEEGTVINSVEHAGTDFTKYIQEGEHITIKYVEADPETWVDAVVAEILAIDSFRLETPVTPIPISTINVYCWNYQTIGETWHYNQAQSPAVPIVAAKLKQIKLETGVNWGIVREAARFTATNRGVWDMYRGFGIISVVGAVNYINQKYLSNEYRDVLANQLEDDKGISPILEYSDLLENSPVSKKFIDRLKTIWDGAVSWISTNGTNLLNHLSNTDIHVGIGEKSTWNGKQNALGFTPENSANKNQNNGYAPLDSGGKVPLANLPSTLLKYIGQWNALTNTPTLTNPDTNKKGYVYDVSVGGTIFGLTFAQGDWLIYNDSGVPEKSDNSDDVVSVNGQTGVVTITASGLGASTDIHSNITALNAVSGTNTGDNAPNSQYSGLSASKQDRLTFSTDIEADKASTTKISSIKTFYDWAVRLFQKKIISISYADLYALTQSSGLTVGQHYIISDYRTVHTIPNTEDINEGQIEPLIVTALTTSNLANECYSTLFPQDIIYYDIESNQTIVPGCTKGYIYRRVDTKNNNDIGFDYRNVKFRRWKINCTVTDSNGSGSDYTTGNLVNKSGTNELYVKLNNLTGVLFDDNSSWERFEWDNLQYIIPQNSDWYIIDDSFQLIIPFIDEYKDYYMFTTEPTVNGVQSDFSTIYSNKIDGVSSNLLVNSNSVILGAYFNNNSIGAGFNYNSIGAYFNNNSIGAGFNYNSIGAGFNYNSIGAYFNNNSIGAGFNYNSIGAGFNYNSIGAYFNYNSIGAYFNYNSIGANFNNNSIGAYFNYNSIGAYFNYNSIGAYFNYNSIGAYFTMNNVSYNFNTNSGVDFSGASKVYGYYNKDLFVTEGGLQKLMYYSDLCVSIVVDANA